MLFAIFIIIYFIYINSNDDDDDDDDDDDEDDDDDLLLPFILFQYMFYMYLLNTIPAKLIIYEYFHYLSNKLLKCVRACNIGEDFYGQC